MEYCKNFSGKVVSCEVKEFYQNLKCIDVKKTFLELDLSSDSRLSLIISGEYEINGKEIIGKYITDCRGLNFVLECKFVDGGKERYLWKH